MARFGASESTRAAPESVRQFSGPSPSQAQAWRILALLTAINCLNYLDRNIVSILAQQIKADLRISDAQIGFLYGTAFAVFFSLFGMPAGRLADGWARPRLLSLGILIWSGASATAGLTTSFAGLAAARMAVGIGESVATPCAQSLITDSFPPGRRALAVSIYVSAVSVGGGLALLLGGFLTQHWPVWSEAMPVLSGLKGWQVAFMVAGVPGIVLAGFAWRLPEPERGALDRITSAHKRYRLADLASELTAVLPPLTLLHMSRHGGRRAVALNVVIAALLCACAAGCVHLLGDWPQFVALALGLYAMASWHQSIALRDPPLFALMLGSRPFALLFVATSLITCISGGVAFWAVPYAIRNFALPAGGAGMLFGLLLVGSSVSGMLCGGTLCDRWSRRDRRAPAWLALIGLIAPAPFVFLMFLSGQLSLFVAGYVVFSFASYAWTGAWASFAQELVLPRMRGTVSSAISLGSILISLAIGPYMAGRIGMETGALAAGVLSLYVLALPALLLLLLAIRHLPQAQATIMERARLAGEDVRIMAS